MSKKPRARTERREREREQAKLIRERDRLARPLPGGSPERPIEVSSASVIEVQAKGLPCPLCGGEYRIDEHTARSMNGDLLRVVRVHCHQCGAPRDLFFRLSLLQ